MLTQACQEIHEGVTERTIATDIAFLRDELNAPLPERANRWHGFKYEESYSIFEGLDDSFAGTLDEVLALVRQLSRKPEFAGLEDLLLRLEQRSAQLSTNQTDVLQFDEPDLKGRQHLLPLYRRILSNAIVMLTYEPFDQEPSTFAVRPVLLRQFNSRWFLFGWREDTDALQTYALDRINAVTATALSVAARPFNARTYFENRIGVTKGSAPVQVLLRFSQTRRNYVLTKKLHVSQQTEEQPDGCLLVQLTVELNRELEAKILEFGPDAEVLEPSVLRERIQACLAQALTQYS
ncbi:WYL domain-containing protein [Spirosoma knui]